MAEKKTFESQTAQLAEIVNTLQSGEASLDEAMKLFEKGVKLAAECNKMLDTAEKKHILSDVLFFFWRSRRDLNPRYPFGVHTISSRARYDHFDTAPCGRLLLPTCI